MVARSILVEILQAANQVNKNDSVIITRVPVLYQKKKSNGCGNVIFAFKSSIHSPMTTQRSH